MRWCGINISFHGCNGEGTKSLWELGWTTIQPRTFSCNCSCIMCVFQLNLWVQVKSESSECWNCVDSYHFTNQLFLLFVISYEVGGKTAWLKWHNLLQFWYTLNFLLQMYTYLLINVHFMTIPVVTVFATNWDILHKLLWSHDYIYCWSCFDPSWKLFCSKNSWCMQILFWNICWWSTECLR